MSRKIQHKRGLETDLPFLGVAEIGFTTDSSKPFIGSSTGNIELSKKSDLDTIQDDINMQISNANKTIGSLESLDWLPSSAFEAIKDLRNWQNQTAINVRTPPYNARCNGTDDSVAIQSAITKAITGGAGGYIRIPRGTYSVANTVNIDDKNIFIQGDSHFSIIKWMGVSGGTVLSVTGKAGYGNRGGGIQDIIIDGNNTAGLGMYIGQKAGTVVGNFFRNIRIQNLSTGTGMVWDAIQNNYFELLDIEYCQTSLEMTNGAGNNVVMKSEFATSSSGGYTLLSRANPAYQGYGNNAFANSPQGNTFYMCIFERGDSAALINLVESSCTRFLDCEFSSKFQTVAAINIESTSTYTYIIRARFAGGDTTKPAIINKGYVAVIDQCSFVNYPIDEVTTSNKVYWGNNFSNLNDGRARIRNTGGDAARNICTNSAPSYGLGNIYSAPEIVLNIGEFHHNSYDELFFRTKNKANQIVMGKSKNYNTAISTATTTSTQTYPLSGNGSWTVDATVSTGDKQHSRSQQYLVRFSNISPTAKLADVQAVCGNAVGGSLITNVGLTVSPAGVLSLTGTASTSTTMIFAIRATCQIDF